MAYQYIIDPKTNQNSSLFIKRTSDNATIPNNLKNKDWAEYQSWLNDGNTPDEAS